ncbi:S-adenosyl-L-methionine-dependent methyltransferase [Echria macrotheca]|uniref:Protein arginine methyltransferase NDUFAF7 n=1 Tax=Echria macrotheca TaxID=438768 RepID=A0AAJ0BK60_9PEZI|nr:S-adenosyl-L-methionine-dependent methyltransferase [Echria macrotheca]
MDSPVVTQLFRQLFGRHPLCPSRHKPSRLTTTIHSVRRHRQRASCYSTRSSSAGSDAVPGRRNESNWQQRTTLLPEDRSDEFRRYPTVTAKDLRGRRERPRRVKMLMRDFIEDSLYNPQYGYFSQQVVIFSPGEPFDFGSLRDEAEFQNVLSRRYVEFEDRLDAAEGQKSDTRQLWYTPTELFRPYYGEAVARYLVANYKLTTYPYHDLIIYEMGAGRGTLMTNILDYIRDVDPAVYARTRYKIIEISSQLATLQSSQLMKSAAGRGHADRVEIINQSIFDWTSPVPSPCFFLAFEVFDNFAHDVVRYDLSTETPMQGVVLIDDAGDFFEFYTPQLDPVASRFFRVREAATDGRYRVPYPSTKVGRWLALNRPFAPNLSAPEYIPTRLMQFFDVLGKYFPAHRLLTSDFHSLPDAIKGLNAPIVQTRFERRPVPVTTPLVHQGYFDIMFPTDFGISEAIYQAITGKLTRVMSHEEFMTRWADVDLTETRSGENPLLSWYRNASVLCTV